MKFKLAQGAALPDLHRLQFRAGDTASEAPRVDLATGRIAGVSLLTADREAAGHGLWIDRRTLDTGKTALEGRRLKAYATHGAWGGDGTLDEVGFWENVRIDGDRLREDFEALAAWRKHEPAEFETLFELAEKLPQEFGASIAFAFTLAWVRKDGTEIPTQRRWRAVGAWDYEAYFDPAMPADAVRDLPSVRITDVFSADFVCRPAANDGLFSAASGTALVDAPAKDTPAATHSTPFAMLKQLNAKFSAQPALLQRAIALHLENEQATFAEITGKVEAEQLNAELVQLRQVSGAHATFTAALEKAGFKASGDKSAVEVLLAEHATFKAAAAARDTDLAALKAAGFESKDGKSPVELALAALKKERDTIAALRNGGSAPIDTGAKSGEGAALGNTKTRAEFMALSPKDRLQFSKSGGKIVDPVNN